MPYGDDWRAHRRLMQQYLNVRSVVAFRSLQTHCVLELLEDLLAEPDAFWRHVKRCVNLGCFTYSQLKTHPKVRSVGSSLGYVWIQGRPPRG